jgi:hypothetical protein
MVIAGLIWQPEIGPIAYAIATTASPKANAIPNIPIPGGAFSSTAVGMVVPLTTAAPQPNNTKAKVPMSSAKYFFIMSDFRLNV